jgi:ribosome biogenesis GTPase
VKYLYQTIGYEVLFTSTRDDSGIDLLAEKLKGKLSLLAGNSGVGKSSLINKLVPGANLRTGEISELYHTGTHTTTFSEMLMLPEGGAVIDVPGVKGFGVIDFDKYSVGHYFPEIFKHSADCRYSDCTHRREPGCAVVEALENHYISESRYNSYLSILEEVEEQGEKYRKPF